MAVKKLITDTEMVKGERMSVLLYCPECDEILDDDQESIRVTSLYGDSAVLACSNCEWVGNVLVKAWFEKIDVKEEE